MKCVRCGSENIAPSDLMYECRDCGCSWNCECNHDEDDCSEHEKAA